MKMERKISGTTELLGILGKPVHHSISPKMQNAGFQKLGLDYAYLAFNIEEDELEKTMLGLRALNFKGVNVTMPHKIEMCKYVDKLSLASKLIGAVNTVVNDGGILTGHITDGTGYMRSLKENNIDIIGRKMTIVGAGGAATAIYVQAALDGVKEISIFNKRDKFFERAEEKIKYVKEQTNCDINLYDLDDKRLLAKEISESVILTNATGIGMKPYENETYITEDMLRPELIVSDIIYEPEKTLLLQLAEKRGCTIINGLGMLLWQGAASFELWTGKEMPIDYIKNVLF